MKRLLSISLLGILLLPSLLKVGIIVDFKLNQEYIARVLCINRDEPLQMCSGSCFLNEQLGNATEKEQKELPNNSDQQSKLLPYIHQQSLAFKTSPLLGDKTSFYHQPTFFGPACLEGVFRPPEIHLV